jgi:hypothetical protein
MSHPVLNENKIRINKTAYKALVESRLDTEKSMISMSFFCRYDLNCCSDSAGVRERFLRRPPPDAEDAKGGEREMPLSSFREGIQK